MFNRGGKVWVGEGTGLVFLEKDWDGGRLPEDLVEEAGLLATEFELLSKTKRAELAGYFIEDNLINFLFNPDQLDSKNRESEVFLAWDANDWLTKENDEEKWKLEKTDEGFLLFAIRQDKVHCSEEFPFKFKVSSGAWIDPPDFLPSQIESAPGCQNLIYNPQRSGRDILEFRIIETRNSLPIHHWSTVRPENMGYSKIGKESCFRLFAPRAHEASLILNTKGANGKIEKLSMNRSSNGIWEYKDERDFENCEYSYEIFNNTNSSKQDIYSKRILDPYAKACISRDGPALILESKSGKTEKTHSFETPKMKDLVIVEAHIRDLLKKAPFTLNDQERSGFNGLTKWIKSEDCYLRRLGINAIELQPIQQFDSRKKDEYHWGYMPVNFFSPCSDYASCPEKAQLEFQELVNSCHESGIAVILDVVYNHFGIPNHLLNIDREIYLSTDNLGRLTNHSGCGNDLRCDAQPVKKMILDSLKHWVENYQVDGFRFDLAELLGIELLEEIEEELKKINPSIILIAEPWSFRGRLPEKMNQTGYSLWSDRCRESLLEFVKNGKGKEEIIQLLQGKLDIENKHPWQSVQYIESHDDYTFIDRLCTDLNEGGSHPDEKTINQAKLAMILLLLSPGIPMLSAGQDFLRSKNGKRNTYQDGEINALDYRKLEKYKQIHDEINAVIKLRISPRGIFTRPDTFSEVSYIADIIKDDHVLSLSIRHFKQGEEFLFLCNPSLRELDLTLPKEWNGARILFPFNKQLNSRIKLKPFEYLLAVKKINLSNHSIQISQPLHSED